LVVVDCIIIVGVPIAITKIVGGSSNNNKACPFIYKSTLKTFYSAINNKIKVCFLMRLMIVRKHKKRTLKPVKDPSSDLGIIARP